MPEFREDLLVTTINKKRVIGIILVTALLIAAFAFSILLSSLIFGSQRPFPSDQLSKAKDEEGIELITVPFPFNFTDFPDLNLTQDQLSDLLSMLQDMFDGNIDDLDLGNFSQGLAALLASEIEVFRVYNYSDFNNMFTKLWKYECFDEYTGDGWHSSAATQFASLYNYEDHNLYYMDNDILRLKMPLSPTIGINSMVIPNLFPTPFIMNGSFIASNLDTNSVELYQDEFNCTTLNLNFYDNAPVNMSYELFGLDLPTNDEINSTAIQAIYTPLEIQNRFLQLPPNLQFYLADNPYVYNDYLNLNSTISPNDNAFMVANKIRNYLQSQFSFADPETYSPTPQGRDTVDYFCETQEGIWTEFASAFCVFTRLFGVASRFVDGFNSRLIEEIKENNQDTFAIKYKNMYNWAEIYVPTDISGNGQWVQMDVLFDSYGVGGIPWNPYVIYNNETNYNLTVTSNFKQGSRSGQNALITATLVDSQYGTAIPGETITFIDSTTDAVIGTADTDINGNATISIVIDNLQVVGPHFIIAAQSPQITNYTRYDIFGGIQVQLTSIIPQSVNLSISTSTSIRGYLVDPLNNIRIRSAQVEFILLYKGTDTRALPFSPNYMLSGTNGDFNTGLNIDPLHPVGEFEVRVDFNSTFVNPFNSALINLPLIPSVSSSRLDFNITRGSTVIQFYINNIPSQIPTLPSVSRFSTLQLKAFIYHETYGPLANRLVDFYDYTNSIFIGSNNTNSMGYATIDYVVGLQAKSGPNLLYATLGMQKNYSYYILNDPPTIHISSGPSPREINRTGGGATTFNVVGEITDTYDSSKKLGFSEITLKLLRGGVDYSTYLVPYNIYPFQTIDDGYFDLKFGVLSNTPTGNYTLRLDFNGTIYLNQGGNPYPYLFNLPNLSNSTFVDFDLLISTPATVKFNFWIDGHDSYDYYQPVINRNGNVNLSVYLEFSDPIDNGNIIFYDITQNLALGNVLTTNGRASLIYNTDSFTVAGPHLISASWGSYDNYSYFILDDNITLNVQLGPNPRQIDRGGDTFTLQGTITDALNGAPVKYTEIYVSLFDGPTDVSYYLSSNWFQLDGSGTFDLTLSVVGGTPAKNYTINIGFYGGFIYSSPNNLYNEFDFHFDVFTFNNFTSNDDANYELKVVDPNDIAIQFWIDGNPALSLYDDGNLPERYLKGDSINFSVYVTQGGDFVTNGTVTITDVFISTQIGSYPFITADNGRHSFIIDSSTWHSGLHKIQVQWESFPAINTTYIIINDTISISTGSTLQVIQRNVDNFNVYGSVQDGSINLRGLNIKILLLDSSLNDVSGYLNLAGSQIINVFNGNYQFNINYISINCPQGKYYFRIDFNGSINEAGISLTDYMIHSSSTLISVNVTAGTYVAGNYDTAFEGGFYEGDEVHAYGYLYWDNGSLILGSRTITISIEDGLGGIIKTEVGTTDGSGRFNITISIDSPDWPDQTEVWVNFQPSDSFISPDHYYIESTIIELFRP